nr:phenoloxidase-activating factor 3-like [Procambarus clarkii]
MWRFAAMMMMVTAMVTVGCDAHHIARCARGGGRHGACGHITDCPPLLSLLHRLRTATAPPHAFQILRRSVCGYENNFPLVCCPDSASPARVLSPGRSLLPARCGISSLTDRIIDGEDAKLMAWPWMVLLRGTMNGVSQWTCGGVLISERYVLTAAHCYNPSLVTIESVRVGEHTLHQHPDCELGICAPPPQDIPVERVISHPDYEKPCTTCNDIALLRLARPAILNPFHVVPVCLPVNPQQDLGFTEQEFLGQLAWAAGWGSISRDSLTFVRLNTLQQVQLPIVDLPFCEILRKPYPDRRMVLCAGGNGKDTCRGDSGGPLTVTNKVGTRSYVVGITSHGPRECGITNTQGIYTNVLYYISWIISNLQP